MGPDPNTGAADAVSWIDIQLMQPKHFVSFKNLWDKSVKHGEISKCGWMEDSARD